MAPRVGSIPFYPFPPFCCGPQADSLLAWPSWVSVIKAGQEEHHVPCRASLGALQPLPPGQHVQALSSHTCSHTNLYFQSQELSPFPEQHLTGAIFLGHNKNYDWENSLLVSRDLSSPSAISSAGQSGVIQIVITSICREQMKLKINGFLHPFHGFIKPLGEEV